MKEYSLKPNNLMINDFYKKEKENFIKKFVSKKNEVFLYEITDYEKKKYVVLKKFENEESFNTELSIYKHLIVICNETKKLNSKEIKNPIEFPNLLNYDTKKFILITEYIDGCTVLDLLENCEKNNYIKKAGFILIKVLEWLEKFYSVMGTEKNEILGDINLRNFIISNNKIFGLDFENVKTGDRKLEIIDVLAMYMLYNPAISEFKESVLDLVKKVYLKSKMYFQNMDEFSIILENRMEKIKIRRNL